MGKLRKKMTPADGCVWITGGSSGIGAALAEELAGRGWKVAISARNKAALAEIASTHDNITGFEGDVVDRHRPRRRFAEPLLDAFDGCCGPLDGDLRHHHALGAL